MSHRPGQAAYSAARDFRDCEDKLMTARSELAKARAERDGLGFTLSAIRDALGCEPGYEVEAARQAVAIEGADELRRVLIMSGAWPVLPRPGDTLTPADFGKGEAGVLRLAALLSEAPEGAAVRHPACVLDPHPPCDVVGSVGLEWVKCDGGWCGGEAVVSSSLLAEQAPLTVVAWPS